MPEGTHTSRRINTIAERAGWSTYLEIGVAKGKTFLAIDLEQKRAVDPVFRFDFERLQSRSIQFYQMPSDEYFLKGNAGACFDVVFLDGLHVFEQTFRDFCNTLTATHNRSLIVIDDVVPSDVYSAIPDEKEAIRHRRAAGGIGSDWHGDIYKMVFAIHDFFPALSFLTITTGGNPQTFVWREPRETFEPRLNSLEAISRLSWFDTKRHWELMHGVPEDEALSLLSKRFEVAR